MIFCKIQGYEKTNGEPIKLPLHRPKRTGVYQITYLQPYIFEAAGNAHNCITLQCFFFLMTQQEYLAVSQLENHLMTWAICMM